MDQEKAELYSKDLSADQKKLFYEIITRPSENFFITGAGGSGKTVLMRALIDYYVDIEPILHTAVVALMGITASRIFGSTIHSYFFLDPHYDYENGDDLSTSAYCDIAARRVFIDEISMVSARLLAHVHHKLNGFDKSGRAFGGRQMLFFRRFCAASTCDEIPSEFGRGASLQLARCARSRQFVFFGRAVGSVPR